jgi:hypothetical protein
MYGAADSIRGYPANEEHSFLSDFNIHEELFGDPKQTLPLPK